MELIVAVYDDWGIGKDGTQPIALSADRKFFRETTRGAMVIVGRKTLADFPGGRPLPNRVNVVLTRQDAKIDDVVICHSPEEAVELAKTAERAMVIGGGSIYKQLFPYCDTAYITRCIPPLNLTPSSPIWMRTRLGSFMRFCKAVKKTALLLKCAYIREYKDERTENFGPLLHFSSCRFHGKII